MGRKILTVDRYLQHHCPVRSERHGDNLWAFHVGSLQHSIQGCYHSISVLLIGSKKIDKTLI